MSDPDQPDDFTVSEISFTRRIDADGKEYVSYIFDPPDMTEIEILGLLACGRMALERRIAEAHQG